MELLPLWCCVQRSVAGLWRRKWWPGLLCFNWGWIAAWKAWWFLLHDIKVLKSYRAKHMWADHMLPWRKELGIDTIMQVTMVCRISSLRACKSLCSKFTCKVDRRSTSGYCSFVGGNLVTWRSKKQNVVARSSAEAEFRAVAHGICEIMWIRRLLEELKATKSSPM